MGGLTGDPDLESEGARVGGDEPPTRRLRDDGGLAGVAPAQGVEGAESAVFLTDDAVDRQPFAGGHPETGQRPAMAKFAATPAFMSQAPRPCRTFPTMDPLKVAVAPVVPIPDGDDVDVALKDQPDWPPRDSSRPVRAPRGVPPPSRKPGSPNRRQVQLPRVHIHPEAGQLGRRLVLERRLGVRSGDARGAHEIDEVLDELAFVDGVENTLFRGGEVHQGSAVLAGSAQGGRDGLGGESDVIEHLATGGVVEERARNPEGAHRDVDRVLAKARRS